MNSPCISLVDSCRTDDQLTSTFCSRSCGFACAVFFADADDYAWRGTVWHATEWIWEWLRESFCTLLGLLQSYRMHHRSSLSALVSLLIPHSVSIISFDNTDFIKKSEIIDSLCSCNFQLSKSLVLLQDNQVFKCYTDIQIYCLLVSELPFRHPNNCISIFLCKCHCRFWKWVFLFIISQRGTFVFNLDPWLSGFSLIQILKFINALKFQGQVNFECNFAFRWFWCGNALSDRGISNRNRSVVWLFIVRVYDTVQRSKLPGYTYLCYILTLKKFRRYVFALNGHITVFDTAHFDGKYSYQWTFMAPRADIYRLGFFSFKISLIIFAARIVAVISFVYFCQH